MSDKTKGKEAAGASEKSKRLVSADSSDSPSSTSRQSPSLFAVPASLQWIPDNWKWSNIKVVLRCAVAAWLAVVLFVIPPVELYMGQAAFLILIASILSPPSDPFLIVIEREVLIIGLVALTWGWCCLGMRLADLARTNRRPDVSLAAAITSGGQYLEAGPTVILGLFVFIGTACLLYIRARKGPGPYLFASILSCICLTISLTTAALIPYPYYRIGQAIIVPLGFHSVIAVLCAMLLFPQTVSAQFTGRLHNVFTPLVRSIDLHRELLRMSSSSPDFAKTGKALSKVVAEAEAALTPVAVAGRLLPTDLIYNRFAPMDYKPLHNLGRRMAVRANGMTAYWSIIDPLRERFPVTPGPSRPGTPGTMTPVRSRVASNHPSRAPSPERTPTNEEGSHLGRTVTNLDDTDDTKPHHETPTSTPATPAMSFRRSHHAHFHRSSHGHHHHHHHPHSHHHRLLFNALSHLSLPRMHHKEDHAVGVFESHRYLDLEATHFYDPRSEYYTEKSKELLNESCDALLLSCRESLVWMQGWLMNSRKGRWNFWSSKQSKEDGWKKNLKELQTLRDKHEILLKRFKETDRHRVTEPWKILFELKGDTDVEVPSHRYLFHCYVYQYHLMRFSTMILDLLGEVVRLEQERRHNRLWTPVSRMFRRGKWELTDNALNYDEEDPDTVQGMMPGTMDDLGLPRRRDPDALPPRNPFEWIVSHLYRFVAGLGGGNALYAVKAGILTTLMCLPSFIQSSAQFAYNNRFVWAIIMAQLTLARFRAYCGIISYATSRDPEEDQEIVTALVAIRSKLNRSAVLKANAIYEVSSCHSISDCPVIDSHKNLVLIAGKVASKTLPQGVGVATVRWLLRMEANDGSSSSRQLTYTLSHLLSVIEHLEPSWTRAFLSRTRFSDPNFQGDILAVISQLVYALVNDVVVDETLSQQV
ncbi:hypothetical protein AAF712_001650 [Marasmius tenuissimus]|uniref:Putative ER transporter 6TM N-terminal domain-containing protein n=1 Tax=Marasmius tenuissimus TaxID=585030 RepID=A0ABR3ACJ2_9AGAR